MVKFSGRTPRTERFGGPLFVGLWVGLCGCDSHNGEPLLHQNDDAQVVIDELRVEVGAHAGLAERTSEFVELQNSEAGHEGALHGHLEELEHGIGDMGMCEDVAPDLLDALIEMRGTCDAERGRHQDAMMSQTNITDGRAEEQRHQLEMTACLSELDEMMEEMRRGTSTAMCREHHGMDGRHRP
ncbi:MAG: hypothetical protein ACRBN8_39145 [Nannocystales bacterium]